MENDMRGDDSSSIAPKPSSAEARDALSSLGVDGARLAERVVTPWWYHPTLGALVAVIISTQALSFPGSLIALPLALFALPALVVVYRRRYGLWIARSVGPRSRRIFRALMVSFLLAFATALVIKYTAIEYGWVLLPAAVGFVASVVLGPWYDDARRRELRETGRENA
jgi:uncharacterized membrane protein